MMAPEKVNMSKPIHQKILELIPEQARKSDFYRLLKSMAYFFLSQRFVTVLTEPFYQRSHDLIEIDVTYACNLKCFNCNRSCGAAPSDDRVSLEQIKKFIGESISRGMQWKRIRLLGGEPALHPQLLAIIGELLAFKAAESPGTAIELWTNGFGKKVNEVLARIDPEVIIMNSAKKDSKQCFEPFNLAPKDFTRYKYSDFSCGCWIISECGLGLSPYGYYPCAVGAAIDRVVGLDIGRKSLPESSDAMRDQMEALCGYCGHFMASQRRMFYQPLMSKSWQQAYEKYRLFKPDLTRY
jgi:hypothetical protein